MTKPTLQKRLARLREELENKLQKIEEEHECCESAQIDARDKIQELQEELRNLRETCRELEAERAARPRRHVRRETELVLEGLEASYATLVETQDYWITKVRLRRQRQTLIEEDPQLKQILQDYKVFEQSRSDTLRSVPPSYRQILVEEHENRTARVSPYLDLLTMERGLACQTPVEFQIILAYGLSDDRIGWVFPFRHDDELSSEAYAALCEVVWSLQREVINLGTLPGWFWDDMSMDTWAGFDTLLIQGDYSGHETPLESANRFMSNGACLDLFRGTDTKILLAEMSRHAWRVGQQHPEPEASVPEPEEPIDDAEGPSLEEITDGWYTEDDIVSWERPLRIVSDSLWNVQARRLRTLLVRMVARGKVGERSVELRRLWEDLPSPHKENLETGVGRLLEEGLIVESEANDGREVRISPERLEDVQNLINRDVTQFWAGIIGSSS